MFPRPGSLPVFLLCALGVQNRRHVGPHINKLHLGRQFNIVISILLGISPSAPRAVCQGWWSPGPTEFRTREQQVGFKSLTLSAHSLLYSIVTQLFTNRLKEEEMSQVGMPGGDARWGCQVGMPGGDARWRCQVGMPGGDARWGCQVEMCLVGSHLKKVEDPPAPYSSTEMLGRSNEQTSSTPPRSINTVLKYSW
jgi:hypothetical protein